MTQIILTAEQVRLLDSAEASVAICRPDGTIAGFISPKARFIVPDKVPFTPEEIAAAERDADNCTTFHTTEQVLARLNSIP